MVVAAVALFAAGDAVSETTDNVRGETTLRIRSDWKAGEIVFALSESVVPYLQRGSSVPAYDANRRWQSTLASTIAEVLRHIPYGSGGTTTLSEALRRGTSRSVIEDVASRATLVYNGLSSDGASVEARYRLLLHSDVAAFFPVATEAVGRRYQWVASREYSGIVIIASIARPTLSPVIYDQQSRVVLRAAMVDNAMREQHGAVGYDTRYRADEWQWRVGTAPLILYARGVRGERGDEIVIANRDAEQVLSRDSNRELISAGRVLVIVNDIIKESILTVGTDL